MVQPHLKITTYFQHLKFEYFIRNIFLFFFCSDLLFTGGDPMVMTARQLRKYIDPLIGGDPELDHLATIRIGSKSLAYWPYRYLTDKDSDDVLR